MGAAVLVKDHCEQPAAHELAERLRDYWRARGFVPPTMTVEPLLDPDGRQTGIFQIRSDMKNGWPMAGPDKE